MRSPGKRYPHHASAARFWLASALVTLALSLVLYGFISKAATGSGQNFDTFLGYTTGMEYLKIPVSGVTIDLDAAWKPRVLSRILGSAVTAGALTGHTVDVEVFRSRVALWEVGWFLATALAAFLGAGRFGIIFVLANFCGILFTIQPGLQPRIYPWDAPSLFFFTVGTASWMRGRPLWFIPLLPIAVLFKETAIVFTLSYLFLPGDRRGRARAFGAAFLLAAGAKVAADAATSSFGGLPVTSRLLLANLRALVSSPLLLLTNAGFTVAAFLLMPWERPTGRALGIVALAFTAGIMTFAVASEYRIWFEMLPLGSFAVAAALDPRRNELPAS